MELYIFYGGKGMRIDQDRLTRLDVGPLTSDESIKAVVAQTLEIAPFDLRDFVVDPSIEARKVLDPVGLNVTIRPPEEFA
jgi:hypothetical protein